MGNSTSISWTDATWNPVRGCSRVSEGCRHCYAERVAMRFSKPGQPYHGLAQVVAPRDHLDRIGGRRDGWTREVRFVAEHLADPLRWKKPRRIFVNSMSDLFHEKLTNEQIAAVFGVMAACPQHTFQVLTKRAKRMREWFAWAGHLNLDDLRAFAQHLLPEDQRSLAFRRGTHWPLRHVWLGVSVENQEAADKRIPELLATPAAVRFLSCEPLIGPVDFCIRYDAGGGVVHNMDVLRGYGGWAAPRDQHAVKWVIAGCESGPGARPCDVAWLRSLRDQCAAASVPFFLKQAVALTTSYALYPSKHAARAEQVHVDARAGSRRKAGGVIELPYLDGVQHAVFPGAKP